MSSIELYLSLGSNTGDRKAYLESALNELDSKFGCHFCRLSAFIETEPWGFECDDKFMNAVVCYELLAHNDGLTPQERGEKILDVCKEIEVRLGRCDAPEYDKNGNRVYHSRTIDIDILFIGTDRIGTERLTVPHRLMKQRDFVMVPLKEIASDEIMSAFPDIFE